MTYPRDAETRWLLLGLIFLAAALLHTLLLVRDAVQRADERAKQETPTPKGKH